MSSNFPFQNPDLPFEQRVEDLVSRLTLEEKVGQMLYTAPPIERLGIPAYNWWNEALHGVARAGRATVFPQAVGLAATWDTPLLFRVATAISDEARAKYHEAVRHGRRGIYEGLTFWSPNINIFRDPRWGRGMETYGEDPYLSGQLAIAFVKGMQGNDSKYLKTVATPKHFAVHSGPEPLRHQFDAVVDERDLRETYLPAFRAAIIEGNAQSVMCAYNRFDGLPCCGSSELLQKILRQEWGFSGYVVSDCWAIQDFYRTHKVVHTAVEAAAMAAKAGTDLNCGVTYDSLALAVRQGLVDESLIDASVRRLFRARFRLGMFDPPERVPYAKIPYSVNDSPEHQALALEASRKSIVLLKNEGSMLPLSRNLRRIAVLGPNAEEVEILLGNYNGTPSHPVTPLEGIKRKLGSKTEVLYARGCDVALNMPSLECIPPSALRTASEDGAEKQGLHGEYFQNCDWKGKPVLSRLDPQISFEWLDRAPASGLKEDSFSIRWTGKLLPPSTGQFAIGLKVFGSAKLFINDTLIVEITERHSMGTGWKFIALQHNVAYRLRLEYCALRTNGNVQLVWGKPAPMLMAEAVKAATEAEATVLFLGLSPRLEGEEMPVEVPGFLGGDRVEIGLPEPQEALLEAITALRKPMVVVLLNGSALAVNRAATVVPSIVEAWYPGQAAGTAIADVLFGDYNPAGRLPVTFYRSLDQLPPFTDYSMKGRTYRYFTGEPLFPFGHGLSYTNFHYSDLQLPQTIRAGDSITVSVTVENTGKRFGEEVVQLYVSPPAGEASLPNRSLQAFRRIGLAPGKKSTLSFTLNPRQISFLDKEFQWSVQEGIYGIAIGGKQPGFHGLADSRTTDVLLGQVEITGRATIPEGQR